MATTTQKDTDAKTPTVEEMGTVYEDLPVLEDYPLEEFVTDTLEGRGGRNTPRLFLIFGLYDARAVVVTPSRQAVLDVAADEGALDHLKIEEEKAREMEERGETEMMMRLGNASEAFDIEHVRVTEIGIDNVRETGQRLRFGGDGWMHLRVEYTNTGAVSKDLVIQIDEGFRPMRAYWFRGDAMHGMEGRIEMTEENDDFLQSMVRKGIHRLIRNHR